MITEHKELRTAIKHGDNLSALQIIDSSPNCIADMTPFGTWLHVASSHGRIEVVKRLVDMGADINISGGSRSGTALNVACARGHRDIALFLLSHGADIDTSAPGSNPLYSAIIGGHIDIVKDLIRAGVDTRVAYSNSLSVAMNAEQFARIRGQTEIASLLAAAS